MDQVISPRSRRSKRIVVNIDEQTLVSLDRLAVLASESRSRVVGDILELFAPMFEPVAVALHKARSNPAEAVRMLQAQANTVREIAEDLVEQAKALPGRHTPPFSNTGG